ncbi:MAG TPA: hypothetical protein VN788_13775 [Verrucomicrobiae bacterium]|nr:hypothetical protein [Verrucomicrobiae bacterium]HXU48348.1 hypothetical protein [Candidatus Binatia bacterium]
MSEQAYMPIRYSSGTENVPNTGKRGLGWLWWAWIGFVVLLFLAWRSGWLEVSVASVANPNGWK